MAMKSIAMTSILAAMTIAGGCFERTASKNNRVASVSMGKTESQIAGSLRSLLQCSTDVDDCFVIIEELASGKFVQFAGSTREPLLLDLPIQALSAEERARAQQLFSKLSASTETESGFQMAFDRNAEDAAKVAVRVFREVYSFGDDVNVTVTER